MNCDWLLNPPLLSHKSLPLPHHLQWWLMPGSPSYTGKGGGAWGLDKVCCLQLIFRLSSPWKKIKYNERGHIDHTAPVLFIPDCVGRWTQLVLFSVDINCHFLTCSPPFISWFICHYHSHMQTPTAVANIPIKKKKVKSPQQQQLMGPFFSFTLTVSARQWIFGPDLHQ